MTQIDELQGRITRALDRISQSVEGWEPPAVPEAEPAVDLSEELAAAKAEAAEAMAALEQAQADSKAAQIEANVAREAAAAEAEKTRFAQDEVENLKEQLAAMPVAEAAPAEEPAPEPAQELTAAPDQSAELEALREELEDEKMANAQLEERLRILTERQKQDEAQVAEPAASDDTSAQKEAMAHLNDELQRLQQANTALEDTVAALREANAQGVGEPHLINKAMLAELESLRATRATEAAETNVILAAMEPILAEAAGEGNV